MQSQSLLTTALQQLLQNCCLLYWEFVSLMKYFPNFMCGKILRSIFVNLKSSLIFIWGCYDYWKERSKQELRRPLVRGDERDVTGKIVIITGCNSGIGKQTALELATRGAVVIMACRNLKRAEAAKQDIVRAVRSAKLDVMCLDLSEIASIRRFAAAFKERYSHLDILINNAGINSYELTRTKDGFESHIGVNYLGHFLLTLLLLDSLMKTKDARVIGLSSTTIPLARLSLHDLMLEEQSLGIFMPYANSKLAMALFIKKLGELVEGTGIRTYALCCGLVKTNMTGDDYPAILRLVFRFCLWGCGQNLKEGCETVLYCALSTAVEGETGRLYRFLDRWDSAYSKLDDKLADQLWQVSEKLVGLEGFARRFRSLHSSQQDRLAHLSS